MKQPLDNFKGKTMTQVLCQDKTHELRHAFSGATYSGGTCNLCGTKFEGYHSFRSLYAINFDINPDLSVCTKCENDHWMLMKQQENRLKISFDFDCTLGETIIQKLARIILPHADCEVFIVTSRNKGASYNRDLFGVAERLNIREDKIYFTEGGWKWKTIQNLGINIHFDDVPEECELIMRNTKCLPMLLWDDGCMPSVKHESFGKGLF